jgi:hypothetical protein
MVLLDFLVVKVLYSTVNVKRNRYFLFVDEDFK